LPGNYSRYIPLISLSGDFVLLNLFFVAGFCHISAGLDCFEAKYLLFYAFLNTAWLVLVFVFGAHNTGRNTSKKSILVAYIKIIVFFFFLFLLYFQATSLSYFARDLIKYLFILYFACLVTWKFLLYYAFYFYRKKGFNFRTVVILGDTPATAELREYFLNNRWHGYLLLGFFSAEGSGREHWLGSWSDLGAYLASHQVDEIYIALRDIPSSILPGVNALLSAYPVRIRVVPDLGSFSLKNTELINYGSLPVIQIHPGPVSYWYNRLLKRTFDVILSLLVILFVLSWMTPLLYLLDLFGSRNGVFFRQRRTGLDGRSYTCIKFRTMRKNPESDTRQATRTDERITGPGRFLRKFSLDELPQFLNVVMGEMSVVGPRPHMLAHTDEYRKLARQFMLRHTVKPGITGLAQVRGYRGEIKNPSDIRNRVACDMQYIENWSISLDLKIIFLTLWIILKG
jgi:Undecaprenyl-phosphate glucose phosphotransferase